MSMNEGALKSMAGMIQAMLPYELDYLPESTAGQTINEIFYLLRENNPKLDEFKGFMGFVLKKMDDEEIKDSEYMDVMLMEIWAIIDRHYPPKKDDEKVEQPFVFHPFDKGQYDDTPDYFSEGE